MKTIKLLIACVFALTLTACNDNDASVVSQNIATAADKFEIDRRIVFYNGITNDYI